MNSCHQQSSMSSGSPWTKEQQSKSSSGRRQGRSQEPHPSSQLRSSLLGFSQPAADRRPERNALSPRHQGASGSKLFLDFQAMKIFKEGAEEDSASDLSDSERGAIPPSPFAPPDLNLRAEEIDLVSFHLHPDPSQAEPESCYPDFLPPPFSSWDLQDMALVLNMEGKSETLPRPTGFLGKYIDRLLQLEWLQTQTVQWERARTAKTRPSAASGASGALKSPGRSRLLTGALSKSLPSPEGASKWIPSRRKGFHQEEAHPSHHAFETSPRSVDGPGGPRLGSQKQAPELRIEKKKKSGKTKLQHPEPSCLEGNPAMEASGNIRIPIQSPEPLGSAASCRAPRTQAQADLKKKGTLNTCLASSSREKKPKTNGGKHSTYKFK